MKFALTAVAIVTVGFAALPASAQEISAQAPSAQPIALSTDDLPLTDRFASLLASYRNCVFAEVDAMPLGDQRSMARHAMDACALSREELRAQLVSDIRDRQPQLSPAVAQTSARSGMEQVDPMIEAAAIDWVHLRYASNMI